MRKGEDYENQEKECGCIETRFKTSWLFESMEGEGFNAQLTLLCPFHSILVGASWEKMENEKKYYNYIKHKNERYRKESCENLKSLESLISKKIYCEKCKENRKHESMNFKVMDAEIEVVECETCGNTILMNAKGVTKNNKKAIDVFLKRFDF